MERVRSFVGGEFVEPVDSSAWLAIPNPSTGETAVQIPDSDTLDVVRTIQAANRAWTQWQKIEEAERAAHLIAIAERIESAAEALAHLEACETGVLARFALKTSVPRAAGAFRYYAELSQREATDRETALSSSHRQIANRLPVGVVTLITAQSDPLAVISERLAPALAAGNVVILKPSSKTSRVAQKLAEIIKDSGLPAGVFNCLLGRGDKVGRALVGHPGLSSVFFTGKTETGREVWRESSEFLKRVHLSLSASNPVLVFAGVDLPSVAAQVAQISLSHQGPSSLRGARIFVQETIYKDFLEALHTEAEKTRLGDPLDANTTLGPLVSERDKSAFRHALEQAVGEKGKLLSGGSDHLSGLDSKLHTGFFVAPSIIYDLTLCSTLQQEEVLGPFVTVSSFKYQHDAIKHANNSPFGQAAYLFHPDPVKAARISAKLDAGRVFSGGGPIYSNEIAVSGIKNSGLGTLGGAASLDAFSRVTNLSLGSQSSR